MENRGLIYRKHGKGTFAHGRGTRPTKMVALLLKTSPQTEHWPISEMIRGIQNILSVQRVPVLLVNTSPSEWTPEMAGNLGGVIVFPSQVTSADLIELNNRKLPYIIAGETIALPGPQVSLGQTEAARKTTENLLQQGHRQIALLTGYDPNFDAAKREGIYQALRAAHVDPAAVPEFDATRCEGGAEGAVRAILALHPSAVVAFDDSLATLLCLRARQDMGLTIPGNMSVASFHDSPYLRYLDPSLTTVQFDFLGAGRAAAEALNRAMLTGEPVQNITFEPIHRPGQTMISVDHGISS
ncbi:MAG: substrate-binding domain-containing protein [Methylacidiphilales bacterium]|nr:substrate-binding domain-containing protein [Candidatus Methylacidiphilales bacterium]